MNAINTAIKTMATTMSDKIKEKRNRVLLGPLPDDFLCVNVSAQEQQEAADRQTAIALQQQYSAVTTYYTNHAGRLSITLAQAKLAKNYGMTRMDPYCRIRVGHCVYETPTDANGGKNPRWNKVVYCLLPHGIESINIEIFDERSFTMDELIAWTNIAIPQQVTSGETHEDWYPLNGKQGEGVEGMINLVMSYSPITPFGPSYQGMMVPKASVGGAKALKVYSTNAPDPMLAMNMAELKQIEEMFPNIEKEVVLSVFEANRGNKVNTINTLLQMAE